MPVIHCISNFQGTSSKKSQDTANGSFFALHQLLHQDIF